jgi:hypothetical protein
VSGSLRLEEIDARARKRIVLAAAAALACSRWRRRRHWDRVVVVCTEETPGIQLRAAFAESMRRDGLLAFAHEVIARKVPPDHVLVYLVVDRDDVAGTALWVLPLCAELARLNETAEAST